jgi:AmmeMemoRadiSam system protein B
MGITRPPAVAGSFYPADGETLSDTVDGLLDDAVPPELDVDPRMLIVPHAGYIYSGPVAATGYRLLFRSVTPPRRIVLLGPSHFTPLQGVAASGVDSFRTPLGDVAVDAAPSAGVVADPAAHQGEHSLEVQLPFLQVILADFTVLPLLAGNIPPDATADVLAEILDQTKGFGVISSDLSHYLDYDSARIRDERTAKAITELRAQDMQWDDACGLTAVQAALLVARRRGWQCRLLDLRNSGDTAGDKQRVVGYGAFAIGPAI